MTQLSSSRRGTPIISTSIAVLAIAATVSAAPTSSAPTPPVPDNGPRYALSYKLNTGDVLRYEVTHSASIQSTIDGTTQAAQTKTDSIKAWKVTDVLPSGEIEFMNVVERVSMVNQLPDREPVKFDSERDKTPPPGFEDAAKAIGVPLSVVRMTPRGEIVRRDVKYRPGRAEDDAPIVVRLPDEAVSIGATWDEPFEIKIEQQNSVSKSIQTRRHYKLADVKDGIATIEVTYQVLTPIDPPEEAQLVQRMMNGEARFDVAAGRLIGQRMDVDKRILGFAGPTSSMQYVMRMEEKLLDTPKKVAASTIEAPAIVPPQAPAANPSSRTPSTSAAIGPTQTPSANSGASTRRPYRPTRSAHRPARPAKGYRRY